ncbi:MAG: MBL fold metallo-hydrolase [Planctomycetes bacterium]|jgi:glyoxylase-like metal-dependent hydrolase (beta-lactamase superfamily II)|nr:MBL fold metallo-hydrolase [Phycisphaerae bacterium]NBB95894.1 MBL fold metallo-hydrolase [Planctomycetota bacterium]
MDLTITTIELGPLDTNCYVLTAGNTCWIVDPGMWPDPLMTHLDAADLAPRAICLTHGHGDHIGGVRPLKQRWPELDVICPEADADMLGDANRNLAATFAMDVTAPPAEQLIRPGETLAMGALRWQVLDTAGHTPGGVSFYCPAAATVITGDALFAGSIGRTDIPRGDAGQLVANIRNHVLTLPPETTVYPGHGPSTTIGHEKQSNPFLQQADR